MLFPTALITSLIGLSSITMSSAQKFTFTQPTASHWWVAESDNTLAWTPAADNTIQQFSVFLANSNTALLTDKLALVSVQQNYERSKTINPGKMSAGTGYTIQLTDILNSTNVYSTSEPFEIKPKGSSYPAQGDSSSSSASSSSGSSVSGSTTGSSTISASVSATKSSGDGRVQHMTFQYGGPLVAGLVAAEYLIPIFEGMEWGRLSPYAQMAHLGRRQ